MAFAGGQEGGPALVDVLTGAVEPSGRLTVSVPKNVGAIPYYYNHKMKSAGTPIARHFGSRYPFGHGLSYTTLEFLDLRLDAAEVDTGTGTIGARFTGAQHGIACRGGGPPTVRAGHPRHHGAAGEGAQGVRSGRPAPGRVRAGHVRGANRHALLHRPEGPAHRGAGDFELQVGASSADVRLRATVTLTGPARELGGQWRMESRCTVGR